MNKIVTIELPEGLVSETERAQAATGESLADFVATAARQRAEGVNGNSFFGRRAKPFDRDAFRALLRREGGEPPENEAPGRKRA